MLKILTYDSKINKNEKEMKKLNDTCMRNIKIYFEEKENKIKYEEYSFNGIPSPKNIEFKDIEANSLKVNWKIDDINLLNIDKNKIKFKIEIRRDNSDDNFKKIFEGNEMNYLINNLDSDTNYEIRISSVYNDINSNYSEIKKVKTNIDSLILKESKRYDEFIKKIYEWSGCNNMKLLYRGTRDGMGSNYFHNKCNNEGPTISLFKNEKGNIFGGYASTDWTSYGNYKSAPDCFIFTLTNIHGTEPTKFPNSNTSYSIYDNSSYGPTFGGGHDIYTNITNSSQSAFPHSYQDILGKGKSIFTSNLNNSNYNFNLKEIEVFKIFK